jgi:hypothetical protein
MECEGVPPEQLHDGVCRGAEKQRLSARGLDTRLVANRLLSKIPHALFVGKSGEEFEYAIALPQKDRGCAQSHSEDERNCDRTND